MIVPGPIDTRTAEAALRARAPAASIGGRAVDKEEAVGRSLQRLE